MSAIEVSSGTRQEVRTFVLLATTFVAVYFLPVGQPRFDGADIGQRRRKVRGEQPAARRGDAAVDTSQQASRNAA